MGLVPSHVVLLHSTTEVAAVITGAAAVGRTTANTCNAKQLLQHHSQSRPWARLVMGSAGVLGDAQAALC